MLELSPTRLSDDDLLTRLSHRAAGQRAVTAALVAHLAEFLARRLHEKAGFASLFTYCTRVLGMTEQDAYDRTRAAKVVGRFPVALAMLADGRVTLTTLRLLAPHLTPENHQELLAAAVGRGKREVQDLVAHRFPQPDVETAILPVPVPRDGFSAIPPPLVRPLSPERCQVTFTAGAGTRAKLELAQDLLRHAVPDGDPGRILERALRLLVEELVKKKYAQTGPPRTRPRSANERARHIPADVKRAVFLRDLGRCAFVADDQRRCGERAFVEFHHVTPFAAGGRATVANIELRCRAHNGYEAAVFESQRAAPTAAETVPTVSARADGKGAESRMSAEEAPTLRV